ncbi:MAG: hypothetical protein P1P80_06485 [ANME-2 cluster archaeon]|nr:hypothetical protein [ANME-2 cluster archaeon]
MGIKTIVFIGIFALFVFIGGISVWNDFALGFDYPPSDHPASAHVEVEDIRIEDDTHGPVSFTGNYVLETQDGYYQFKLERRAQDKYTGRVRVTQVINEESPIIMDVLSTRGSYADPEKTQCTVKNHHFSIVSKGLKYGNYRPYHLIPGNPEIADVVRTIDVWDRLEITGFDVNSFRVDANNPNGYSLFYDAGCRTMIVTSIEIS